MAGLGRKILSAFVEVTPPPVDPADSGKGSNPVRPAGSGQGRYPVHSSGNRLGPERVPAADARFMEYFDKLFSEANIPGPDYYEFSKMIEAMQSIADEQSKFNAAYAGLYAQGVDKTKLLSTAQEYLRILETDAQHFHSTVDTAIQEKVQGKKAEVLEKSDRIRALTQEIDGLQDQIKVLQQEIKENEEKIAASSGGYMAENAQRVARIQADIEKIKNYLH